MTQISRERREVIEAKLDQEDDFDPENITIDELRALLRDSAWRERIEREVRELVSTIEGEIEPFVDEEAYANDVRAQIASRIRTIVARATRRV